MIECMRKSYKHKHNSNQTVTGSQGKFSVDLGRLLSRYSHHLNLIMPEKVLPENVDKNDDLKPAAWRLQLLISQLKMLMILLKKMMNLLNMLIQIKQPFVAEDAT